jgi:hypothetical protein
MNEPFLSLKCLFFAKETVGNRTLDAPKRCNVIALFEKK